MTIQEAINNAVEPIIDNFNGSFHVKTKLSQHRNGGEVRWVIHHCDYCEEPYFRRKYDIERADKTCSRQCLVAIGKEKGVFSSPDKFIKTTSGHLYFKDNKYGNGQNKMVWAHHWAIFQKTGKWPKENVHHIDINKENNDFSNLWECTNSMHQKAHMSLNSLTSDLLKMNIIKFNRKTGEYTLNKQKGNNNETND